MDSNATSNPIERTPLTARAPVLKVMGLGGGGSNAINRMIELGIGGIGYIAANTDSQALESSIAPVKIQLGPHLTRGLGSGGDPITGEAAAEESYKDICAALSGADMVFLTAGMGGGTGTGAISVAARAARSIGAVSIGIVTTPFTFEVGRRQKNAQVGLAKLRQFTHTLISVPNDRLLSIAPQNLPLEAAFSLADDVLRQGIQGISEIIHQSGMINVDFSHVRNLMLNGGGSLLSIGQGQGEGKAKKALENALHHPLLDTISMENTSGVIANFSGGNDLTFQEVAEALENLQEMTGGMAEIIPGVVTDDQMENRVQVILVITGLGATAVEQQSISENTSFIAKPEEQGIPIATQHQNHIAFEHSGYEIADASTNLDLPAFIRRRVR